MHANGFLKSSLKTGYQVQYLYLFFKELLPWNL